MEDGQKWQCLQSHQAKGTDRIPEATLPTGLAKLCLSEWRRKETVEDAGHQPQTPYVHIYNTCVTYMGEHV